MSNIAIIPARGGSKRIPQKNIKDFLGKPIIAYSIETAIKSSLFDEIMISTDDKEIAEIAQQYGAQVPFFRSNKNADDYATLADVIDEVKQCYINQGKSFDHICCILPAAPLISIENLKRGYEILIKRKVDSVRPVVRYSYPIQRALRMNDGKIEMFYPQYKRTRSQDLEPTYHDCGQFYWMRFETGLHGLNKIGFEIPEIQSHDIDVFDDWEIAKIKYKIFKKNK